MEWNEIFNHIVNTTVTHLQDVHGGVRVPKLCEMKELVGTMGIV